MRRHAHHLLTAIFLVAMAGCSTDAPTLGASGAPTRSPALAAPPPGACGVSGPTMAALPEAFMLAAPRFTAAAGHKIDGTALTDDRVETWVGDELTEMLFVGADSGYDVYARGFSTVEHAGADGPAIHLDASTTSEFASSVTGLAATLDGGAVRGTFQYQSLAAAVVNGQSFNNGYVYEAAFCATLVPVAAGDVVPPPSGGTCTVGRSGAITITWTTAGAGATYQIGRSVNAQALQVLATTPRLSYRDASPEAAKARDPATVAGVGYYVNAVGPTGIRNPLPLAFLATPMPTAAGLNIPGTRICLSA